MGARRRLARAARAAGPALMAFAFTSTRAAGAQAAGMVKSSADGVFADQNRADGGRVSVSPGPGTHAWGKA